MIGQGLVMMVQAALNDPTGLNLGIPGGFAGQLPKDMRQVAWTYKFVSGNPETTLLGTRGFRMARVQVDCFGPKAADALTLAYQIDNVLNGFQGTLADPDATYVSSLIQDDFMGPDYSETAQNFWVMLQYEIWFNQN